jgi:hypothetical protein
MPHLLPSAIATLIACTATLATADPLPPDARPVSGKSLAKIYAGRTAEWSESKAYFAPDGSLKGIHTGGGTTLFWGKWTVKGNEVCMQNSYRNLQTGKTGSGLRDCWAWWQAADGTLWQLWTVRYDNSKPPKDDYYTGEEKKLKKGDLVSKKFDRLNS